MIDTLYYGEHCSCSGHSHFHNESPAISFNVVQAFLQRIHNKPELAEGIDPGLWSAVVKVINEATVEGLSQSNAASTHDEEFYRALRHSNEVFAAFKVHSLAGEVAKNLLDSDGKLKPFRQWADDVKGITSHYVGAWLRTEYDTAVIRAHNAADWREFERNKDILPNLRWMPTTSPSPEGSHRNYWTAKLTLPIDDPFWNDHHPGDRWNCKCSLEATDDPVNRPADMNAPLPQKGLENNPGKDGHTFNDTHPYFPDKCSQCSFYKPGIKGRITTLFMNRKKDCYNCPYIDGCIDREKTIRSELRTRAKEIKQEVSNLKDEVLHNPKFPHDVHITMRGIKEWLNQPHEHFREKNELLLSIKDVFANAQYLGPIDDHKKHNGVVMGYIFETEVSNDTSWIIVHQTRWDEYVLYSISDSSKLKEMIKK